MSIKRIPLSVFIKSQLPAYVRENYPLVSEFLEQYYKSLEYKGGVLDLIQNIDSYLNIDTILEKSSEVSLTSDISFSDDTINVNSTQGFPESYGLIKIDDEIITYTSKTNNSFIGCVRGFSGISNYNFNIKGEILFESTEIAEHKAGTNILNISSLFLKEFLKKIKVQLAPGFESRELYLDLNKANFIKKSKDFYRSKGTDESFNILFMALYGEKAKIIKPSEQIFKPSDAYYEITNDFVVESVEGNPLELENSTLLQDEYGNIPKAYAPITNVTKIVTQEGKEYYKLKIDSGYDRDVSVDGATYGNFSIHPKTLVVGNVSPGDTEINVDSTIGFDKSSEIIVQYNDGTTGLVSYTDKSINQFKNCTGIIKGIDDGSSIDLNTYAYGYSNISKSIVKVRIRPVLQSIDFIGNTKFLTDKSFIVPKSLGTSEKNIISEKFIHNISVTFDVISIIQNISITNAHDVSIDNTNIFNINDEITIISSTSSLSVSGKVISINDSQEITIQLDSSLPPSNTYKIKRNISKAKTSLLSHQNILKNQNYIQNSYTDKYNKNNFLVASSSLPNTNIESYDYKLIISGSLSKDDETIQLTTSEDHGFYTGDSVYYNPNNDTSLSIFDTGSGIFFIKRVDSNNVKLSRSRSQLFRNIFSKVKDDISLSTSDNHTIQLLRLKELKLDDQKILRKIEEPVEVSNKKDIEPDSRVGILVNGVELITHKSSDIIHYGQIEKIDVISGGSGYDIINPPVVDIVDNDHIGIKATASCSVKGSLKEIRIVDPGLDYLENPIIKITGGNGSGASCKVNIKKVDNEVTIDSSARGRAVDLLNDTIIFPSEHNFKNGEEIIYQTNGESPIVGLSTNSLYYINKKDNYKITLHSNYKEALSGIGTIYLSDYGVGNHIFKSKNNKSILGTIVVTNPGSNYENKKRVIINNSIGINTSTNIISIENHGYNTGEIVKYNTSNTPILNLSNNKEYYIYKVDNNNFKLCEINNGVDKDFYLKNNEFINLNSSGSGIHSFNYQDIRVELIGQVGIKTAIIQPIFRGEITSVNLSNKGTKYGSEDIINLYKAPEISLNSGKNAAATPIIKDGVITQVVMNNVGGNYNSPPDIVLIGNGIGALLTPVIKNGVLEEIIVIKGGKNYDQDTRILISPAGSNSKFYVDIQKWTVNNFEKLSKNITQDDGFLVPSLDKNSIQYCHLYPPRYLRENNLYQINQYGESLYTLKDLVKQSGSEVNSTNHSPIVGWSYDGCPIYGPYGYSGINGGSIVGMKSGYKKVLESEVIPNRPSFSIFGSGFFVEDYVHESSTDESVLDEHNGRFCITPDFPNGTYAYFMTLEETATTDSLSKFHTYKKPVFPYSIGNKFNYNPNKFNLIGTSTHNNFTFSNWMRNTYPYGFLNKNSTYDYIEFKPSNQKTIIESVTKGDISKINVEYGGESYSVGDRIIFDDNSGASARVTLISGESITKVSSASTSTNIIGIEKSNDYGESYFDVFTEFPHNISNDEEVYLSGINTTSFDLQRFYKAKTEVKTLSLTRDVEDILQTGYVTYFYVSNNYAFSKIRENDIFNVGTEHVKILSKDPVLSRLKVLRAINNTTPTKHKKTRILYEVPRKLTIENKTKTTDVFDYKVNKEYYLNPKENIAVGLSAVGIKISTNKIGVGVTDVIIPQKSIYLQSHDLKTGDILQYSANGGDPIKVSLDGITIVRLPEETDLYVAKINEDCVGISTVKVGLGSTGYFVGYGYSTSTIINDPLIQFIDYGFGDNHSFTTKYKSITGIISKNTVTVNTKNNHNLSENDFVEVKIQPNTTNTIEIKYSDYYRTVLVDDIIITNSSINIENNTIEIQNHGFKNGQKIIFTSTNKSQVIVNKPYYAIVFDDNHIRLSDSLYKSTKDTNSYLDFSEKFTGSISLVNPPISLYKGQKLKFDLSDNSLSYLVGSTRKAAFNFNFYKDNKFSIKLNDIKDENGNYIIKIIRNGTIGTLSAYVLLEISNGYSENIYYNLSPIDNSILPPTKKEVFPDILVNNYNSITLKDSVYSGKFKIYDVNTKTFKYNLKNVPELNSYDQINSNLSYTTDSKSAYGPINRIDLTNKGKNYEKTPEIGKIITERGSGAVLKVLSDNIGSIKKYNISDIGQDFPRDLTLSPEASIPQVLYVSPFYSLESINIISSGLNYTTLPKLLIIDKIDNVLLDEIDLIYRETDQRVDILKNTYRLNDSVPKIVCIENSNGFSIQDIEYNSFTYEVKITISKEFSSFDDYPFEVGDEILIENTNIKTSSSGQGYNSSNYNYNYFILTEIDPNIGGEKSSLTFNIKDNLNSVGAITPGEFDIQNSSGSVVLVKHFPVFDVKLKSNQFNINEIIETKDNKKGQVLDWDNTTGYLLVLSNEIFNVGDSFTALSSKSIGNVKEAFNFKGFFDLGPYSTSSGKWQKNTGFLNDNLQRIQDSFYYQNFSYSIKSKISFETWNDVVSTLNHTVGFKKFSDLQVESTSSSDLSINKNITKSSYLDSFVDIISKANTNCFYNFDLVKDTPITVNNNVFSDNLTFPDRILTDYYVSKSNRVLLIDDISDQFSLTPREEKYSTVHTFNLGDSNSKKIIRLIKDKRYINKKQISISNIIHNDTQIYYNEYGILESDYEMGSFDTFIEGSVGITSYYPTKYQKNDFDIITLSYDLGKSGISTDLLLTNINYEKNNTQISGDSQANIVSIGNTFTSLKLLVQVSAENNKHEYSEINLVRNNNDIYYIDFGWLSTFSSDIYASGLGTFYPYINGNTLDIDFIPNVGSGVSEVNTMVYSFNSSENPFLLETETFDDFRSRKLFTIIKNTNNNSECIISNFIHDDNNVYFNQYSKISSDFDIGQFDIIQNENDSSKIDVFFYPKNNDNTLYDHDIITLSTNIFRDSETFYSNSDSNTLISKLSSILNDQGINVGIVTLPKNYSSYKLLVQIEGVGNLGTKYEVGDINIVHDNSEIYFNSFGWVSSYGENYEYTGFGTFSPYFSGENIVVDFIPNVGSGVTEIKLSIVGISSGTDNSPQSTFELDNTRVTTVSKTIIGSNPPVKNSILTYSSGNALYCITQVKNIQTNTINQSEFVVLNGSDIYSGEFSQLKTGPELLGEFTVEKVLTGITLYFTPYNSDDLNVRVFGYLLDDSTSNNPTNPNYITSNIVPKSYKLTNLDGTNINTLKYSSIITSNKNILGSNNPSSIDVISYSEINDASHFTVSVRDVKNDVCQLNEGILIDDDYDNSFLTEFGHVSTSGNFLGTFGTRRFNNNTILTFTPNKDTYVNVKVYMNTIRYNKGLDEVSIIDSDNTTYSLESNKGEYYGTYVGIKKNFDLKHDGNQIFFREFDGSNNSVVDLTNNTITIPDHYFVTGERLVYKNGTNNPQNSLKISPSIFAGIGTTSILPETVYAIKVDNNKIKLSRSADEALSEVPIYLNFTSVGIGTTHSFSSTKQNTKALITIDNIIQSPIYNTKTTKKVTKEIRVVDDIINISNSLSIFSGDLIKINDEIMTVLSTNYSDDNTLYVERESMGTKIQQHSVGDSVIKLGGEYNIQDNIIYFSEPPKELTPISTSRNSSDEIDWIGVSTSSKFHGRIFLRSGITSSTEETYSTNFVFDDISDQFFDKNNQFTLTSDNLDVGGIENNNAIVLINNVLQNPGYYNSFYLNEEVPGITTITFSGKEVTSTSDVNTSSIPLSGIIISVGSTEGYGYQSLISAGGTAVISINGKLEQISISNNGSGYRNDQIVNVKTIESFDSKIIEKIVGKGSVSNGKVIGVQITDFSGIYDQQSPPKIIFDAPLSYTNIPLVYSSSSQGSNSGKGATVNIVVGEDNKVIDFTLNNTGYSYQEGDILTIPTGGSSGIPTLQNVSLKEFQLKVEKVFTDKFSGWTIGNVESLDNINHLFNGVRKTFPLSISNSQISIRPNPGSDIKVKYTLLVFINDIIQIPDESYLYDGGGYITFTEAPNHKDTCKILYYKGTEEVDIEFTNIEEIVKVGDNITVHYNNDPFNSRTITKINSIDNLSTKPYYNNNLDGTSLLTIDLCKQTEDIIVENEIISKSRKLFDSKLYPTTETIQNVSIASTIIHVENVIPLFNQLNEGVDLDFQKYITLYPSQDKSTAYATCNISGGVVTSISIIDGGDNYSSPPKIIITPPNNTSGTQAEAKAVLSLGKVSNIQITNPGSGYAKAPLILIESPSLPKEINEVNSYEGDCGIIVGIETGYKTILYKDNKLIKFDFFVEEFSALRNSELLEPKSVSTIKPGYYFKVKNSNLGDGITSLSNIGSVVGVGSTFIDNIYQAYSVDTVLKNVAGIGVTYVTQVTTLVDNFDNLNTNSSTSDYYGDYCWGRINLRRRTTETNPYTIDKLNDLEFRSKKLITLVSDSLQQNKKEFLIVNVIHDDNKKYYMNQYGSLDNIEPLGSFDFSEINSSSSMLYYPMDDDRDYDITTLTHNLTENIVGYSNTSFLSQDSLFTFTDSKFVISNNQTNLVDIDNDLSSMKLLVQLSTNDNNYEYGEINITTNGTEIHQLEYGWVSTTETGDFYNSGLGTVYSYVSNNNIKVDFIPNTNSNISKIDVLGIVFKNNSIDETNSIISDNFNVRVSSVNIPSSSTQIPVDILTYPNSEDCSYNIISITDNTNNNTQLLELIILSNGIINISEFGSVYTNDYLGTFDAIESSGNIVLTFTPTQENSNINIKVYSNSMKQSTSDGNNLDLGPYSLTSNYYKLYKIADKLPIGSSVVRSLPLKTRTYF